MSTLYGDSIFETSSIVLSESDISILAEYFTEYPEIIDEQYFSKKDLQDPETLKKLLARFDKEKAIKDKVDNISLIFSLVEGIALGILTKKISIGFISTVGIAVGKCLLFIKTSNILSQNQSNRIKKLREKAVKLRDKAAKENTPEAKEIVNNCNKLIAEIDKYFKKIEKDEYKKKYNDYKHAYQFIIDIIHSKNCIEEPDKKLYIWCQILKIDFKLFEQGMKNIANSDDSNYGSLWDIWFGSDTLNEEDDIETSKILSKYIPEFKDNTKVPIYYAIDDTVFFYSRKANKFYYGDYWFINTNAYGPIEECIKVYFKSTIEDFIKNNRCNNYDFDKSDIDMDLLKAVDADLGYYRLSPPPEGVKPKKI